MYINQKGFSFLTGIMLMVLFALIAFSGWKVYLVSKESKNNYSRAPDKISSNSNNIKHIVAIGDIVCDPTKENSNGLNVNYCQDSKVAEQISKIKPDAILGLGDLQYEDGSLDKFNNSFSKNWNTFNKIFYPAPGNHEYGTKDAGGYFSYFNNAPADVSKGYYSFDIGNWKIISLNSNCDKTNDCDQNSAQIRWLNDELKKSPKCTLAFWHHPHFTSGKYVDNVDAKNRSNFFWESLISKNADVILNGHDHLYERFDLQDSNGAIDKNGIRQFTVGTGGKELYKQKSRIPNSQKLIDDQFGFLTLDLKEDSYNWKFINIDGNVLDSGFQYCR